MDLAGFEGLGRHERRAHQASEDPFVFPVGHGVILLASNLHERRLLLAEGARWIVAKLHISSLGTELIVLNQEKAKVGWLFQGSGMSRLFASVYKSFLNDWKDLCLRAGRTGDHCHCHIALHLTVCSIQDY